MLRDYQQRSIDMLYEWLTENDGNPCLVLPTGSGKSHIVAALCKNTVKEWPSTRILMMSHVQELIGQNAEKMRLHWPNAPLGIYSAGLRKRQIDVITFASVQSVAKKARLIGHVDMIIVDECHLINNRQQGSYRTLIAALQEINPHVRIVGLSATPYRLGQGTITEGDDALFADLIEPVTVKELVERGFLASLKSKHTTAMIDTRQVKKRGGEFISSQLNTAADAITAEAIVEIIERADGRKHWLLFCSGVEHAENCASELRANGITAACLHGKHSKVERAQILKDFTEGRIQALTNCDILTTGFDFPDIDLIAFLRPTMSPALYVQMAGRGMRLKSHTDHCLVLDFAGNVEKHGPIVNVEPPKAGGDGTGEAPVKACPECDELLHTSCMLCPECGYEFPKQERKLTLSNADIMGIEAEEMPVTEWKWQRHVSRRSGKEMVKVKYYSGLAGPVVDEYFCVTHETRAGMIARAAVQRISEKSKVEGNPTADNMIELSKVMNTGTPPTSIKFRRNGRFFDVQDRIWSES